MSAVSPRPPARCRPGPGSGSGARFGRGRTAQVALGPLSTGGPAASFLRGRGLGVTSARGRDFKELAGFARQILFAELAEELERAVPHAGQAGLLALVQGEGTLGAGLFDEGEGGADGVIDFGELLRDFGGHALHGDVEQGDFDGPAAHLAPLGGEHLVDEVELGGGAGLVFPMYSGPTGRTGRDPRLRARGGCREGMPERSERSAGWVRAS